MGLVWRGPIFHVFHCENKPQSLSWISHLVCDLGKSIQFNKPQCVHLEMRDNSLVCSTGILWEWSRTIQLWLAYAKCLKDRKQHITTCMSNIHLLVYIITIPPFFSSSELKHQWKPAYKSDLNPQWKKKVPQAQISIYISHTFHPMLTRERISIFKSEFQNLWVGDHAHFGMINMIMPAVTVREVCHGWQDDRV